MKIVSGFIQEFRVAAIDGICADVGTALGRVIIACEIIVVNQQRTQCHAIGANPPQRSA